MCASDHASVICFEVYFFGDIWNAADCTEPKAIASAADPVIAVAALLRIGLTIEHFFCFEAPAAKAEEGEDDSVILAAVTPAAIACFKVAHYYKPYIAANSLTNSLTIKVDAVSSASS